MSDKTAARWGDLQARVASAIVMAVVGIGAIWIGGWVFAVLVVALIGAMIWELAKITAAGQAVQAVALGGLAVLSLGAIEVLSMPILLVLLALPALAMLAMARKDRMAAALYALAIMVAGYELIALRERGVADLLVVVLIVIASDIGGYFAGRLLGGPKFWPAISPKKTWSGTVAGWIGAAIVAAVFAVLDLTPWSLVLLAPFVAFAGQLGDIMESWFKRRAGVKDSSNLIPGHGGVLDRFDAMIFAGVLLAVATLILGL